MASSDTRSDEALLGAMATGDESAGVAFVRRYQRRAFGLALSIVGDPDLAEDIAQEALVRTWRHAQVYDSRRASVTTWVLTITRNLAIDALRMRRAVPIDPDDIINLGIASSEADPSDLAQRTDATARVRVALASVPHAQRRALVLSAYFGLTAEEISRQESIPLGTAKTRIRAGLGKVRALLAADGTYEGALLPPRAPSAIPRPTSGSVPGPVSSQPRPSDPTNPQRQQEHLP
ncbi:MAG TPA: sigma-70 family RNA polymerase sigma factor [Acidimicrobiales bacterium]|nr:sigma-70 family RNA polymerase sigma factor [Acidimicrobiales bacterium]